MSESPSSYPDNVPIEEQRRAYVLDCIGSGDVDGRVLVANCKLLCDWLETGKLPVKLTPVK